MYALALSVRCDLTNRKTVPLFRAPHGVLPLAIPPSIHALFTAYKRKQQKP